MRRSAVALTLLALAGAGLVACGEAPSLPAVDLLLEVVPGVDTIETGKGFPLTVRRVWRKDLVPGDWHDGVLAPLTLRHEATSRVEDGERVQETRRYRAYAFVLDDVVIPSARFSARPLTGGAERVVRAPTIRIGVTPVLDSLDPGEPELPTVPAPASAPVWPWIVVGVLGEAVVVAVWVRGGRRRRRLLTAAQPAAAEDPGPSIDERFLDRLASAGVIEAADIVRDYCAERFGVGAREMTTPELLTALRHAGAEVEPGFVLGQADLVKFAAWVLDRKAQAAVTAAARKFVRESAP